MKHGNEKKKVIIVQPHVRHIQKFCKKLIYSQSLDFQLFFIKFHLKCKEKTARFLCHQFWLISGYEFRLKWVNM
jgi:hypothetical protein